MGSSQPKHGRFQLQQRSATNSQLTQQQRVDTLRLHGLSLPQARIMRAQSLVFKQFQAQVCLVRVPQQTTLRRVFIMFQSAPLL